MNTTFKVTWDGFVDVVNSVGKIFYDEVELNVNSLEMAKITYPVEKKVINEYNLKYHSHIDSDEISKSYVIYTDKVDIHIYLCNSFNCREDVTDMYDTIVYNGLFEGDKDKVYIFARSIDFVDINIKCAVALMNAVLSCITNDKVDKLEILSASLTRVFLNITEDEIKEINPTLDSASKSILNYSEDLLACGHHDRVGHYVIGSNDGTIDTICDIMDDIKTRNSISAKEAL